VLKLREAELMTTADLLANNRSIQQRDWLWRGWQTRYTFLRPVPQANQTNQPVNLPIILLHGFGAASGHWRQNIPALSEQHTVYALDLLGFGASEKPPTLYQVNLWVEQVFDFWRTFIDRPAVIVGNSIGSLIGLIAAQKHPEMARGIVAISLPDLAELEALVPPVIRPVKQWMESVIGSLLAKPLFHLVRQPKVIEFVLKNLVYIDRQFVDAELVEIITVPAQERQAAEAFLWINRGATSPGSAPNVKQAIDQLRVPMLILWGTKDRLIPIRVGRKLANRPSVRMVELPELGHCAHDENPAMINQAIMSWISENL